jgi:hypothetical protein
MLTRRSKSREATDLGEGGGEGCGCAGTGAGDTDKRFCSAVVVPTGAGGGERRLPKT